MKSVFYGLVLVIALTSCVHNKTVDGDSSESIAQSKVSVRSPAWTLTETTAPLCDSRDLNGFAANTCNAFSAAAKNDCGSRNISGFAASTCNGVLSAAKNDCSSKDLSGSARNTCYGILYASKGDCGSKDLSGIATSTCYGVKYSGVKLY